MERDLYINMTNMSKETSMVERKRYMNARTVQDVLIKMSVARELTGIALPDLIEN